MSIVRVNWDHGFEQQFLGITPLRDEVVVYQTRHDDPNVETNDIEKIYSRGGFDSVQALSFSPWNQGITGVGQINGTVCIFDITQANCSVLRVRPKQARPCNAVSFNGTGLVAAGFDKGRQDNSLQVWNVEHYSRTSQNDHIKRPSHSYLPNEAVLSCMFRPDSDHSILAGSYKYLREIDLRSEQPSFQLATRCTSGINVDPFQNQYFSSMAEDGSVAIWDSRKLEGIRGNDTPVLQFHKLLDGRKHGDAPCLRYSTIRKGEFSALFNGDLIRRWQTGLVPQQTDLKFSDRTDSSTASLKAQSNALYNPVNDSLFVSLVLDVKPDYSRVVAFDYSPDLNSPTSTNFVCMRQSGSVFRMPVVECIELLSFNSYNEFSVAGPEGTMTKFVSDEAGSMSRVPTMLNRLNDFSLSNNDLKQLRDDESVTSSHLQADDEDDEDAMPLNTFLDISDVLSNDICTTIRKRATLGYGHDCENNIKVLELIDNIDNQLALRNTWKWLSLAKKSLDKGTMVSGGVDLGFLGVLGIWTGIERTRFSGSVDEMDDEQFKKVAEKRFTSTVKAIVSQKGKKAAAIHIPSSSERKAHRKLCLIVSGWYFSDEEFDERLKILVTLGFHEKAAGWAVFHGHVDKAVEILSTSPHERLRLMATAVAGYLAYKDTLVNSPWKDQCRKLASELDNPYLRAIFAFIADNDWWDVLDEHSLPLRERLGVALRFLLDRDLTVYLERIADYVVAKGELEGLILTGITERGVDLMQLYVDRTSDVQTAALMASFGSPRYVVDTRISHWIDCYRGLLNSWQLYHVRARFDVQRAKLSIRNGTPTLQSAPKQVFIQCPRCNKNLSKSKNSVNQQKLLKQFKRMAGLGDVRGCPNCGAQLPRCSVCLLSLGTKVIGVESDWFSFCLTCHHGCHAIHAEEWFSKHYMCPVPDCSCRCNSI